MLSLGISQSLLGSRDQTVSTMKIKAKHMPTDSEKQTVALPFILTFLTPYEGASGPTTSGTYDNIDAADVA